MKLLLFTLLMMLSFWSIALEFYRCIDDKNQVHFTNLPIASLDINCLPKDRYTMMLNQSLALVLMKQKNRNQGKAIKPAQRQWSAY